MSYIIYQGESDVQEFFTLGSSYLAVGRGGTDNDRYLVTENQRADVNLLTATGARLILDDGLVITDIESLFGTYYISFKDADGTEREIKIKSTSEVQIGDRVFASVADFDTYYDANKDVFDEYQVTGDEVDPGTGDVAIDAETDVIVTQATASYMDQTVTVTPTDTTVDNGFVQFVAENGAFDFDGISAYLDGGNAKSHII